MAGFCVKCGRPLPENGVCSCTQAAPQQPNYQQPNYQQPPYQQQPYQQMPYQQMPFPQGQPVYVQVRQGPTAFQKLGKVLGGYFKDPVGATRSVYEQKDVSSSAIIMCVDILLVLLGTLFFALVRDVFDFGDLVPAWLIVSLFAAPLAYMITFGLAMLAGNLSGTKLDAAGTFAAVGVSGILPTCLLAATMLLGMISAYIFEIFAIMLIATWAISAMTLIIQVLRVKMNIVNTVVLIAGFTAAFILTYVLMNWFLFDGNMLMLIGKSYDFMEESSRWYF